MNSMSVLRDERRQHPRLRLTGAVELVVEAWSVLELHDVSLGGLRVSVPTSPSVGDSFEVTLRLPFGRRLSLLAEVRNVAPCAEAAQPCQVGLAWVDVEDRAEDYMRLRDLIAAANIERETRLEASEMEGQAMRGGAGYLSVSAS
jgi:hypothetical protein